MKGLTKEFSNNRVKIEENNEGKKNRKIKSNENKEVIHGCFLLSLTYPSYSFLQEK